ncbi:MAG: pyridoxal-phosphate dependent enzyme [Chitinophagaceae bacterium]|nr:MAG: pyridoxal-phosphate dependent enzyme [Chitinophagaceae bacterium]
MEQPLSPVRLVPVKNWCQPYGIRADVLRLDELHPQVSGNKWFKLAPWLERSRDKGCKGLITFGGPWSNHLLATAEACRLSGMKSIGVIRGERPAQPSVLLQDVEQRGMELHFLERGHYRAGRLPAELQQLSDEGSFLVVPEGGYGSEGCTGAARITQMFDQNNYTHILAAVGTGTTLAGLAASALPGQKCIGISVLKNNHGLEAAVGNLLPPDAQDRFRILHDYHEGGYARHSAAQIQFMNDWYARTGVPSDFVYTGKLFFAAQRLVESGYFANGSRLLLVHSGGLQGNRSLPAGTLMF